MAGRSGRRAATTSVVGPLEEATQAAIEAAGTRLGADDRGAVAALLHLARKIDTEDEVREAFLVWQRFEYEGDRPPRPLQLDNVSVPTYLKFCESLGLTPAGRSRLVEKPKETGGASKVTQLRQRASLPA